MKPRNQINDRSEGTSVISGPTPSSARERKGELCWENRKNSRLHVLQLVPKSLNEGVTSEGQELEISSMV